MSPKLDIDVVLATQTVISDVKVGQKVLLQELDGVWTACQENGDVLGQLPQSGAVAHHLRSKPHQPAVIRSVKRNIDTGCVSSVQIRVTFPPAGPVQPLIQAELPPEDPSNFTLTTTSLERLAFDPDFRTTLQDPRLQQILLRIDSAPSRELALKEALEAPNFQEFADRMLQIMKPSESPRMAGL